jgi:two-component system sensor histidine kinase KdpD
MNDCTTSAADPSNLRSWAIVALLLTCATTGGFALDHHVSLTSQAMFYVLAVVVASYYLRWQPSVGCAVGAVTSFNFFFVPPRWTFEVESREHLIALFTMLLVALVISHLAARLRRETEMAQTNLGRASQLQELASNLATATSADEVVTLGQTALNSAFEGPCVLALRHIGDELDLPRTLLSDDADGMRCCMREMAVLGPGTGRWPGLNAWFLPLGNRPDVSGAACVRPALASDITGREHAHALCTMLGQALQRLRLTDTMQSAQREAQRQQMQSTYLAAISHDLRTPLAAIVGAASALQTQGGKLNVDEQGRLLGSIVTEATYLCTVTENTLQLVRLSNAAQDIQRGWESMEEIVGAVLARVRQHDPARRIKSKVPDGLPFIKADPVLLAQLIANLLDNALKYSADTIDLTVNVYGKNLQVAVKDRGNEISEEKYASIFEPYSRSDLSGQRGAGLGLALCRAIAAAHGGTLTLRRRNGGGNSFTFAIPLDANQPEGALP